MSYCVPACNVPCGVGYGVGGAYGGVGSSGLVPVCGVGSLSGVGGGLGGSLSGVGGGWGYGPAACSSNLPGSEVVVQPPSSVITMPGPILSTSGEVCVSGYSPCSGYGYPYLGSGGSSWGGYGGLGLGGGYCGGYGGWRRSSQRRRRYYSGSCGPC